MAEIILIGFACGLIGMAFGMSIVRADCAAHMKEARETYQKLLPLRTKGIVDVGDDMQRYFEDLLNSDVWVIAEPRLGEIRRLKARWEEAKK
jgi:hypothetical protein